MLTVTCSNQLRVEINIDGSEHTRRTPIEGCLGQRCVIRFEVLHAVEHRPAKNKAFISTAGSCFEERYCMKFALRNRVPQRRALQH